MKAIVKKDIVALINATKVGSPTLSGFIASGFSTSNYYKVTGGSAVSASNLNSFEVVCKITTPSSWTSNGRVINPTNGADSTTAPYIEVTTGSATLFFYNGSSYTGLTALTNLASNTTYWLKWIYNGSTIKSYYSTNGKDYTLNAENTPSYKPFFNSSEFGVGCRTSDGAGVCVWNGSVDLNELKITLNGSLWLSGTRTQIVNKYFTPKVKGIVQKANVTCNDITPSDNFVLSGFSSSKYALLPAVPSNVTSYEMVAKFTTGTLDSIHMGILANNTSNRDTPQIAIAENNTMAFDHSQSSSVWVSLGGDLPVSANTTYWAKMTWDGSTVAGYYKTSASADWTLHKTASSTSVNWTSQMGVGIDTTACPFNGSIDLKECYININGQRWWSGVKDIQVDRYLMAR